MTTQTWSSEGYAKNARFVTDLGAPVLELLAPKAGEHILDVGCGDGVLTKKIADLGCTVVGVDSSADFVASASKLGLTVVQQSASEMDFGSQFDAVFSNAALHWMKDADAVIARVARALRPNGSFANGRFVAEMGGYGCVQTLVSALIEELNRRGHDGQAANPWYFPTVEDYGRRLAARRLRRALYRADPAAYAVTWGCDGLAHHLRWLLHRRAARGRSRGLSRVCA